MTFVQYSGHFLQVSRIITTYIDLSQRKFVYHFGTQRFHCLPTSSADSDSSNACVPAFSTSHQPLIMDSFWSLLGAVGSQSAMNVSVNSTWSLIGTGNPQSSFNFSINSTWSPIGTAGSSSFNISISSQLANSTWPSQAQATITTDAISSWTSSFSTVTIPETVSPVDFTSIDMTSMSLSVTVVEDTTYEILQSFMTHDLDFKNDYEGATDLSEVSQP